MSFSHNPQDVNAKLHNQRDLERMAKRPSKKTPAKKKKARRSDDDSTEMEAITFGNYEEEVSKTDFKRVPTGKYELILKGWKYGKTKLEKHKIDWEFETVNCDEEDQNGVKIFHTTLWNNPMMFGVITALVGAEGWEDVEGAELDPESVVDGTNELLNGLIDESAIANVRLVPEDKKNGYPEKNDIRGWIVEDEDDEDEDEDYDDDDDEDDDDE